MWAPPRVTPYEPPRFAVDDPEGYAYLDHHGYAVFKDVLTPGQVRARSLCRGRGGAIQNNENNNNVRATSQVDEGRSLAWDFLESLTRARIDRTRPETWGRCTNTTTWMDGRSWVEPFPVDLTAVAAAAAIQIGLIRTGRESW
jgi:hypothetical protein